MSTLQLTLIILGVAIVLAVIIYNQWYNFRNAPRKARQVFEHEPATDAAERREPGLGDATGSQTGAHPEAPEPTLGEPASAPPPGQGGGLFGRGKTVPTTHDGVPQGLATAAPPHTVNAQDLPPDTGATPQPPHATIPQQSPPEVATQPAQPAHSGAVYGTGQEFDSLVFSVVPLALDRPVSGDAALAAQPPTRRIGKKQFLIQGLNMQTKAWESPRAGAKYSAFEAAIQLANRQGALNEIEFSEFVLKTQAFADEVGAAPDFPDMLHEVARGREVDSFAAQNDAVLNLMLITQRATWSPGYVRQCAARHGFKPSVTPGRLVLQAANPSAPPVLVLSYDPQAALADDLDHAPIHEILFTLDVPNADRAENAFARLREILQEMAETMDGTVTDPDGRKLPAMAMDSIAADMERLYDALEARGFPAGSPSALKLFS